MNKNLQPDNPTYFLVAIDGQIELRNTSTISSISWRWNISPQVPRFLSGDHMQWVRHMIACIWCDFAPKDSVPSQVYGIGTNDNWQLVFERIPKGLSDGRIRFRKKHLLTFTLLWDKRAQVIAILV